MLSLLAAAAAFTGPTCAPATSRSTVTMSMGSMDRRTAVAAAVSSAFPLAAFADSNEDAMLAIAAKNAEKLEAEKKAFAESRRPKTEEEIAAAQESSKNLILGIAGAGTALSGLFIIPNLQRLAIKVSSGGKDAGYDKIPVNKGKKVAKRAGKAPPKEQKNTAEKVFAGLFAREFK